MKKLNGLFAAMMLLAAMSCSNESEEMVSNALVETDNPVPVRVHVDGFSVTQGEFENPALTRAAQDVADYEGVKAITLAFYNGSTEVYKVTQLRGSLEEGETFGEFQCALPMGSYTMVVVGQGLSEGETPLTLTSPTAATFGENVVRETFTATQTVNITNTDAVDISTTLNRIVSKLQVVSSDNKVAVANKVRMTFAAGGKAFNPTTGLATANSGFSNTVTTSTAAGEISRSNSYLFLASDEQTMDVTIETLDDSDNVLFSKTVTDVPFKRNRVTVLTGVVYSNSSVGGAFQVETDWISDYNGTF